MIKLFNGSNPPRTFLIKAGEGESMTIKPGNFYDVPDAYLRDVTLRVAIACGDLQQFKTTKQGGALEKAAAEAKPRKTSAKASLTKED